MICKGTQSNIHDGIEEMIHNAKGKVPFFFTLAPIVYVHFAKVKTVKHCLVLSLLSLQAQDSAAVEDSNFHEHFFHFSKTNFKLKKNYS